MKHLYAALVILSIGMSPTQADEPSLGLIKQNEQFFLKSLLKQLPDALNDLEALTRPLELSLRSFTQEIAPYWGDLLQKVEDWSIYRAPKVLPNGDIILRKKPPTQPNVRPLGDIDL